MFPQYLNFIIYFPPLVLPKIPFLWFHFFPFIPRRFLFTIISVYFIFFSSSVLSLDYLGKRFWAIPLWTYVSKGCVNYDFKSALPFKLLCLMYISNTCYNLASYRQLLLTVCRIRHHKLSPKLRNLTLLTCLHKDCCHLLNVLKV